MNALVVICSLALLQQASCQCLPAYCLSPPALELLIPSTPTCAPVSCYPAPCNPPTCGLAELLPALAPVLATTISSSLAATLPPLLEAALPTVLTSALAAAAPLLCALPPSCPCGQTPIIYTACQSPSCICL